MKYRVIIVGAGIAGFTAASTLLQHNVADILILEASKRIGGRIHTVEYGGVLVDKGAEFVHGEISNAVYKLVKPHNLLASYSPLLGPDKTLYINTAGHVADSELVHSLIKQFTRIIRAYELEDFRGSLHDYFFQRSNEVFRAEEVNKTMAEAAQHIVFLEEGIYQGTGDISLLGGSSSKAFKECQGDHYLKWKPGVGYSTTFDILSKKHLDQPEELPVMEKVLLNKEVTRVEYTEGEVMVTTADGSTYHTDHVITTVSLGVLKRHATTMFNPPLPPQKIKAIETLGMDCVGKVFMLFSNRWWPNDINTIIPMFSQQEIKDYKANSKHGHWMTYVSPFYPVLQHEKMLCVWFSGEPCRIMSRLTEVQVIDGLMELLNKLVGRIFNITRPESILRTQWAEDPHILGAYSYHTLESDKENVTNDNLAESIFHGNKPVILFAGEATHSHYFSTVHGAFESGRREAQKIIKFLDRTAESRS